MDEHTIDMQEQDVDDDYDDDYNNHDEQFIETEPHSHEGEESNVAGNLLDAISIQVDIVMGAVKMSLEELSALKMADIIKLGNWNQTVKLCIDNNPFAEGILVDLGGVISVKIINKIENTAGR